MKLLSGAVAVTVVLVGSGVRGAAAVLARAEGDALAAGALFQAAKVALSFSLVPIAAAVATNARAMSPTRVVARWAIQFGPGLAVLCCRGRRSSSTPSGLDRVSPWSRWSACCWLCG